MYTTAPVHQELGMTIHNQYKQFDDDGSLLALEKNNTQRFVEVKMIGPNLRYN